MTNISNSFDPFLTDTSYDPFIIPVDKANREEKIKTHLVHIDSRERDTAIYPNPNKYKIQLIEEYKDVVSVQVLNTKVPFVRGTATIPNDFVQEVNIVIPASTTIESSSSGTEAYNLNQSGTDYSGGISGTNTISNTGASIFNTNVDLCTFEIPNPRSDPSVPKPPALYDYIIMKVEGVDVFKSNNRTCNKATAMIYESQEGHFSNHIETAEKKMNPLRSIYHFNVSFYNFDGTLVDFDNQEHSIQLKITTLKQGRMM